MYDLKVSELDESVVHAGSEFLNPSSDELRHYGVVGMKWGIRRGRAAQAYAKGLRKAKKYEEKAAKATQKSEKALRRAQRVGRLAYFLPSDEDSYGFDDYALGRLQRSRRLQVKAKKLNKKRDRLLKKMDKAFKDANKSTIRAGERLYQQQLNKKKRNK